MSYRLLASLGRRAGVQGRAPVPAGRKSVLSGGIQADARKAARVANDNIDDAIAARQYLIKLSGCAILPRMSAVQSAGIRSVTAKQHAQTSPP